jgi:uncharacterized membrane protein
MKRNFILCGLTGWCLEVFWTGASALLSGEKSMMGQTSLLMFPIYGCAAVIGPVSKHLKEIPAVLRGSLYSLGILGGEYLSGSFLRRFWYCPWDYSGARFQYKGLIRLDYFPVWFVTGLLYEKILSGQTTDCEQ